MRYPDGIPTYDTGTRLEALIDYRRPMEGRFLSDLSAEWDREADRLRWETVFGSGATAAPELPGVLWIHTPGPRSGANFPGAVERLASHYWSGVIAAPREAPAPFPCLRYVGPWLSNAACPFCAPSFPAPFLTLPGLAGLRCGAPFQPPVLAIPDLPFDLGPLLPVDPEVLARPDLTWLASSEPVEWLPEGGTRLLAVDSQQEMTVRLVETGQGLGLAGNVQPPPICTNPNGCEIVPPPQLQDAPLTLGATPTRAGDTPVLVLSARRETLWTVHGSASADPGRDAGPDADPAPVAFLMTQRLSPTLPYCIQPLPLGHVLAATYRAQDDAVYVLDERIRGRGWRAHGEARLLRIGVSGTPSMETLATWPRFSHNARYALVAATDDALWLAASAEPGAGRSMHVIVRLEPGPVGHDDDDRDGEAPRWRVAAWTIGDGTLAPVQPRADRRGLSLVVERDGQEQTVGYTHGDLWPVSDHPDVHWRRFPRRPHGHEWDAGRCF